MAEIIQPKTIRETEGKVVVPKNLNYPFDARVIGIRQQSTVRIQKNDILFPTTGNGKPFLITEEITESIYASPFLTVIRCTDISPEYLFLYLNSEVCQIIIEAQNKGAVFKKFSVSVLKNIPVIEPKEDSSVYEAQVFALTHIEKTYSEPLTKQQNRLMAHQKAFAKNEYQKKEKIEDILSIEIANKIKAFSEDNLRTFLTSDLKELNDCFRAKAYKATLILAGSILEAVLIDWLSDIHGVNYFNEEYYVTDQRNGRQKRAELIDYINEIKYIEHPRWMDEANKAHEIRKKRNLVHAKLCMNSDEINESVCRQVIDYLGQVLKTRGVQ